MKQLEKFVVNDIYKLRLKTNKYNFEYIPPNPYIDKRLSGHADLSIFSDENGTVFTSKYLSLDNAIKIDEDQMPDYPNDVQLNCCIVGNNVFLNEKFVSKKILDHFMGGEWNIISVNQGYTKCSIFVVDSNSIITSDLGIYNKSVLNGIDTLLIKPGYIRLDGFDYGFIGGCGTFYDDTVLLTGNLDLHPDKSNILDFFYSKNKNIEYLSDENIFDIGGIIKI